MLYREIIAVCSEIHTEHINILCGQNVEFVNVKPGGTYSEQWRTERGGLGCSNPPPRNSEDIGGVLDRISKKNRRLDFHL